MRGGCVEERVCRGEARRERERERGGGERQGCVDMRRVPMRGRGEGQRGGEGWRGEARREGWRGATRGEGRVCRYEGWRGERRRGAERQREAQGVSI